MLYRLRGEEGDTQRAAEAYATAIRQVPGFAPVWRAMGLHYMKQDEAELAENHFARYLELQPEATDRAYIELYIHRLRTGDMH